MWKNPKQEKRKQACPFCGKSFKELLVHLRIEEGIEDADQYLEAIKGIEERKELREQFAAYSQELWEKKKKGLITAEDYQRLTMEWAREHER